MAEARVSIKRLTVPAKARQDAQQLGRDVAQALHRALPQSGLSGTVGTLNITLPPHEASDPAAISRAVLRALREGES